MWHKIKKFFRTIFSSLETITIVQVVVSSYYMSIGLMLALATKSLVVLLIFALPAVVWWIIAIAYASHFQVTAHA